jgi:hypothetical protein
MAPRRRPPHPPTHYTRSGLLTSYAADGWTRFNQQRDARRAADGGYHLALGVVGFAICAALRRGAPHRGAHARTRGSPAR